MSRPEETPARALLVSQKTKNLTEFKSLAKSWGNYFSNATIILLSGPMAAGKSEFVRSIVGEGMTSSPTFALHNQYQISKDQVVEHWDLYRIGDESELESSGFWDQFSQTKTKRWIFVEWPERLNTNELPFNWDVFWIEITVSGDARELSLLGRSGRQ